MFTGIVHHQGKIIAIQAVEQGLQFTIETQFNELILGESITVDGACLTVIHPRQHYFDVQLSRETLDKTIANTYQIGTLVNLERSLSLADRFGGHYVTGHVEQVAIVSDMQSVGDCLEISFSHIDSAYQSYLMDKGSVCVNGVSLTVNKVFKNGFQVMLIPHTLDITNLKYLQKHSPVNIEFDWMVKVVVNHVQTMRGQVCNV